MRTVLVGIDCATVGSKVGLAFGEYGPDRVVLKDARLGDGGPPAKTIADWLKQRDSAALLAVDAPLGWPVAMGDTLMGHRAGQRLDVVPNELFRRETDRSVEAILGQTPLEVGADRIARTAHAALVLLAKVAAELGSPIPLAWSPDIQGIAAIEVYPAATLVAHGLRSSGYKKREQLSERREIVEAIGPLVHVGVLGRRLEASADMLDAVVCLLSAKDFLDGRCTPPSQMATAEREGWIWVRAPNP